MEETFRLEILDGGTTVLPRRLLANLEIEEGDELRIVTENGVVSSVVGVPREASPRFVEDNDLTKSRLNEISSGRRADPGKFKELQDRARFREKSKAAVATSGRKTPTASSH